jgi:hypothetical protein
MGNRDIGKNNHRLIEINQRFLQYSIKSPIS